MQHSSPARIRGQPSNPHCSSQPRSPEFAFARRTAHTSQLITTKPRAASPVLPLVPSPPSPTHDVNFESTTHRRRPNLRLHFADTFFGPTATSALPNTPVPNSTNSMRWVHASSELQTDREVELETRVVDKRTGVSGRASIRRARRTSRLQFS